ncbi:MAG: thiolase family protein [Solirubrobacterales bacterium]
MRDVFVIGTGMTRFTKYEDVDSVALGEQAVAEAISDAEIETAQVDAFYAGHVHGGAVAGERVGAATGLAGIPTLNLENACASGTTAVVEAAYAIRAGRYDCVVACGFEQMSTLKGMIAPSPGDYEGALGLVFPAWHAMRARMYAEEYGLTREQLSAVAVKNRANGARNPLSHMREEVTEEQVSGSRSIATPLNLFDCCPKSDGAAAVVLGSSQFLEHARRLHGRAIKVAGLGLQSGRADGLYEPLFEDITHRTAVDAYAEAGIGPADVDFAEVHDCFTIAEGLRVEGLGLAEQGTYYKQLEADGRWLMEGETPINASGGLLAKGHPVGATGVAQVHELVTQMRGDAGERQLDRVDVGLEPTPAAAPCPGRRAAVAA